MNIKKPNFWDYEEISIYAVILYPITIIYQIFFRIIKIFKKTKKFPVPIICVGNIYLGGTGKTPLAKEIFEITKSLNKNPAFIKKSYPYLIDEIKMLEKTGKVFSDKDRSKSISLSIANNHNVVILDDGFQDFSIKSNFSILCFSSKQLIGNGLTIPSGPLRENLSSIKRANCIFINGDKNLDFENKIKNINSKIKIFCSKYKIKNLDKFLNKKVVAFAGIGNPHNFFDLLKENNITIKKTISFPDHHNYSENDYSKLLTEGNEAILLTTQKDYLRMNDKMRKNINFVEINLEIEKKNEFINLIKEKL